MLNADHEVRRSRALRKRSRELSERLAEASKLLEETQEESAKALADLNWQRFFDHDDNADDFYANLDEAAREKLRPKKKPKKTAGD